MSCTFRVHWAFRKTADGPECCVPAKHFFVLDDDDLVFRKGGEGDTHGGYLARCPQHRECGKSYREIGEDEYIVGVVMGS